MKVYLDMDEVLTNFNQAVYKVFGLIYEYTKFHTKYRYFPEIGQTTESVSEKCTIDFWRNLNWMHDGARILDAILIKFNMDQVYLLSTPMPNPQSWTGKALWVQDNIPAFTKRLIVTQAPKSIFAGPNTLLIDDKDENIEEFVAAGGHGIICPRPWNKLHGWAGESLQVVRNSLEVF